MNNSNKERLPSYECMFCKRTLKQVGGQRIISQHNLKICLSNRFLGGGNPDNFDVSIKIEEDLYINFRGPKDEWNNNIKEYIKKEFLNDLLPWFCQECGKRMCQDCGSPTQYLGGCDILNDNGSSSHSGIFGIPSGCINPKCKKHLKS